MADEVENAPAKRGPGRPRKVVTEVASKPEALEVKSGPADPRIGQSVEEGVKWISFADGAEYRCADGVITERSV
jgi:hypothetical protein